MTERSVAEVYSLGEHLAEEMTARGWTSDDVVVRMGAGRDFAHDIIALELLLSSAGERNLIISDDQFEALATAFDVDEQFLRNLHDGWKAAPPEKRAKFEPPDALFGESAREFFAQWQSH